MTTLAWINAQTSVCENVSLDSRPASEVNVPGYLIVDLTQTPSARWVWNADTQEWVMEDEGIGYGWIGDVYENGKLVTPKPADQPVNQGTQEL